MGVEVTTFVGVGAPVVSGCVGVGVEVGVEEGPPLGGSVGVGVGPSVGVVVTGTVGVTVGVAVTDGVGVVIVKASS